MRIIARMRTAAGPLSDRELISFGGALPAMMPRAGRSVCGIIAINQTTYRSAARRAAVRRARASDNARRSSPPRGARFETPSRSESVVPSVIERQKFLARAIIARDVRSPSSCSRTLPADGQLSQFSVHARVGSINAMRNVAVSTQVPSTDSIGFAVFRPLQSSYVILHNSSSEG